MKPLTVIVDPQLFFSTLGVPIVKALSEAVDIWLPRELWNVLKNIHLFIRNPNLITFPETESETADTFRASIAISLQQWSDFHTSQDLKYRRLYWIGDTLQESLLPNGINTNVVQQSEWLASSFNDYLSTKITTIELDSIVFSAFRDTTALAISLGSALILNGRCLQDTVLQSSLPTFCDFYQKANILSKEICLDDPVASKEREYLLQFLIHTGVAKFLWVSLELSIFHLLLPRPTLNSNVLYNTSNSSRQLINANENENILSIDWTEMIALWHRI